MKLRNLMIGASVIAALMSVQNAEAQSGKPYIHDPSTLAECDGKYYTFGTGREIGRAHV